MACEKCEMTVFLDGKIRHLKLLFENVEELAWSNDRNAFLYQCPACHTLWESFAYMPAPGQIAIDEARRLYPNARIRD